jgi:hypothetical protein
MKCDNVVLMTCRVAGKKAYCHAVGLGLGVWRVCDQQESAMVQVYEKVCLHGHLMPYPSLSCVGAAGAHVRAHWRA